MNSQKISSSIFLALISLIIVFFSFSYIFVSPKKFSEDENRVLQAFPNFTLEKLLNGSYTRQLHDYFSDQIALRKQMIEAKAITELLMGKSENNDILLARDNYLVETLQYNVKNYDFLQKNLLKIESLMYNLKSNNINSYSMLIPRKVDILADYFPPYYSDERNKAVWNSVSNTHIQITKALKASQKSGIEVFYKTDHHLTAEGIYLVYEELSKILYFTPKPLDYFNLQILSNDFYGTSYSKSGFFFVESEEIKAPSIENNRYKMTVTDTNEEFDTLYDIEYINKKDKYGVFLSGNNAHVKIYDTKDKTKETLLLIKDSFSHALAPFLCEHYNLELIDPRYYNDSIGEYIKENNIKNVLFLFGIDTLASGNIILK